LLLLNKALHAGCLTSTTPRGGVIKPNPSPRKLAAILLFLSIAILLVALAGEAASKSKTLYAFKRFTTGNGPLAGLIFDQSGNLYGTDAGGGERGYGTVFELKPHADGSWTESTLYNFCPVRRCTDGASPVGPLIFDHAGNLYGTTARTDGGGYGVVFELSPNADGSWTEKVLYTFNNSSGAYPTSGLIFDATGNLYGTTSSGTDSEGGVVFELSPNADGSWTESTLYSFCSFRACSDGRSPAAGLIFDATGNLYGTTVSGGAHGGGAVFELTPKQGGSWTKSTPYSFCSLRKCSDGSSPVGSLIFDNSGNLYGTTGDGGNFSNCSDGCGVVFQLTPNSDGSWKESVLHKFTGGNGSHPAANLIFDQAGNLYSTTADGGNLNCPNGCGLVFKLTPNSKGGWYETVLQDFSDRPSAYPQAGLIFDSAGNLYGTTEGYGKTYGSVFEITP
jgi:uncharacterized repeat protein (TIGR03803 family)